MCSFRLCPPNQKVFPTPLLSVVLAVEILLNTFTQLPHSLCVYTVQYIATVHYSLCVYTAQYSATVYHSLQLQVA